MEHPQSGKILRLWVAGTDYRNEMNVSDEILKRTADTYRRIRNTTRFLLANLHGFDPAQHLLPVDDMLALDRWAVARTAQLQVEIIEAFEAYEFHHVYQKLHNFCSGELGGFYLDIIKDRQYTTQADSRARRSCQTAMFHIAEAMLRWMTPILSFTAEEIWGCMPGERGESVFFEQWYALPENAEDATMNLAFWQQMQDVREVVSKELELLRAAGDIGSSLDAEVVLYCGAELFAQLDDLGDELRFVLITSSAKLLPDTEKTDTAVACMLAGDRGGDEKMWISVQPSAATKCTRCWHHREDVGTHARHPELCGRCIENIDGAGEQRQFA